DGGFGHALEPDGRCPGSQPAAQQLALRTLDEADAWDEELVRGACDWLASVAPAEGGVPFVDPNVVGWPHAPWWQPVDGLPPSLVTTGPIAATLLARGVEHPWLEGAVAWLREAAPGATSTYDLLGALAFAEHEPGLRERLEPALAAADMSEAPTNRGDQQADGGWDFPWPHWNATATADWRGSITVDALASLRAG
ncbi:MAG: hypothetical protein QOI80_1904, partial [Solirubrobacteraceae bacterium]|nr:hypothetical protein [Solirubrobacteraceae bacterium]